MTARYYSSEPKCGSVAVAVEELMSSNQLQLKVMEMPCCVEQTSGMAELPKNNQCF